MRLLFDLPERDMAAVTGAVGGEDVILCVPADLDMGGQFQSAWTVVAGKHLLVVRDGQLLRDVNIPEGTDYKAVGLVGDGVLEAVFNGEPRILVRYSMGHIPRYTEVAKALNQIAAGEPLRIRQVDDERVCPRCGRVLPEDSKVCPACVNKLEVLKRLFGVAKPYWPLMGSAVALFWAITLLRLLLPRINRALIDGYLVPRKAELWPIMALVLSMALCQLGQSLLSIARGQVMLTTGNRLSRDLRALVYAKIQALSLNYLSQRKTGDLMNRVTGDTNTINRFIEGQATQAINEMFTLVGVGVILFSVNWRLAILVIVPAPFVLLFCRLVWRRIMVIYRNQWRTWDRVNSLLQDILSGIRVVKAFGQEDREVKRFTGLSRLLADITGRNEKLWNTLFPSLGFVMGIGNLLVLYYGGNLVLGHRMELGELVQFSQYASMIYGPLNWMSFVPRWFAEAMTATERVFEVIDAEPDVQDKPDAIHHKIEGRITLRNVTFGYRSHEPVLNDINLDVAPGEMIGLVGPSGAGKSTLINLVMRFYDADEGQILIDGIDIRDLSQQDLRSQIGVVLQETFLFSGSILDNIRYAKPDASADEVIRAAKIANAHDFIMRFPDGYDTKVGEKGQRLSGGERQRIAIARAILNDPKILILDEATASVDTETEQQIQEALGRLVKNRTTIAIAHRLSTLRNADRLLVIDKGRQVELGTHEELIKAKGVYYGLVTAQRQMSRIRGVEG